MRNILDRPCLLAGLVLALLPALAFGGAPVHGLKSPHRAPGRFLIIFKTSQELAVITPGELSTAACPSLLPIDRQQAQKLARCLTDNVGATLVGTMARPIGGREVAVIKDLSDSGLSILEDDPRVNSLQADAVATKAAVQTPSSYPGYSIVPLQLADISTRNLPLGAAREKSDYTYNTPASNVVIAVLDTGINPIIADFGGRVSSIADCTIGTFPNYCIPIYPGSGYSEDCDGHGTEVADVAGGAYAGVAKGVTLEGVITGYSCNNGQTGQASYDTQIIDGINYVIEQKENQYKTTPVVIQMSVVPQDLNSTFDTAVKDALDAGIVIVSAAGESTNGGVSQCNVSPYDLAPSTAVINVGAAGEYAVDPWSPPYGMFRASWSNFGPCVSLFADGTPVVGTGVGTNWGTSFAAPVVSGIAALYLSATPTAPPAEVKAAILSAATSGKLQTSAYKDNSGTTWGADLGAGSPNLFAYSLVPAGAPPGYVPPPPPGPSQRVLNAIGAAINYLLSECGPVC